MNRIHVSRIASRFLLLTTRDFFLAQTLPPEQTLQTGFDNLLLRTSGLLAIIASDRDGVCLLKCALAYLVLI